MSRVSALKMIKRRARKAGLPAEICAHSFCGTGITEYLRNGGALEVAARIAGHESTRTTQLYTVPLARTVHPQGQGCPSRGHRTARGHLDRGRQGVLRHAGVFAEFETNLRRERQAEGISAAKQRGAYRGRPPRIDMQAIQHRLAMGLSPTQIARELGVSHGAIYKARAGMTDGA